MARSIDTATVIRNGTGSTIDSDLIGTNAITAEKLNVGQLGGRRNIIINGAMQVAQRGTSIACPISTITYTMDRFFGRPNGSTATTVSQVTDAPDGFQYSARVTRDNGQTGTLTRFETPLETRDIIKLRGQKVTVSFYAKAGSNLSTNSISLILFQGNGTEDARAITAYTNETTLINSPKTLTTSWQRFTHTTTNAVASDTTQLAIQFQALWSGTAGANDEYFITGVQLEVGETATPFEHRSYGEELALCQRYYCETRASIRGTASGPSQFWENQIYWPQEMRDTPAASITAGTPVNGTVVLGTLTKYGSRFSFAPTSSGGFYALSNNITADAEL